MDPLLLVILAVVLIAVATTLAPKVGIAGPLILMVIGLGVSLLPFVDVPQVDPEFILIGVLPPLLYSAAVSLPAIEFRRDFGPIAGLSVLLVIVSAIVLGFFFHAVIPGLDILMAVALGAILSPTDAVATAMAKRLGISRRVVTMLEGESPLLNDATSLVLLRTSVAAAALGSSVGDGEAPRDSLSSFIWGVVVAVVVGGIIGFLNLRVRAHIRNPAANTAVGLVVPFIAYLPTEHLGGSGLVAAVVTGIVTGQGAARRFSPEQRMSDEHNWRMVELVLEGAVFLLMGLELKSILEQNLASDNGIWHGVWLAAAALGIVLLVRAVYVTLLVAAQSRRAHPSNGSDSARSATGSRASARIRRDDAGDAVRCGSRTEPDPIPERRLASMRSRVARAVADLDYYQASPLGWKHGTIIVWAGMRGVVTLAAAQTLPSDTPERSLLVFVAFLVAVGSLIVQGSTLPALVRALRLDDSAQDAVGREEQQAIDDQLRQAAAALFAAGELTRRDGTAFPSGLIERVGARMIEPPDDETTAMARDMLDLRLTMIGAMRAKLNDLSSGGLYSTAALRHALAELDADQISLELRLEDD